MKRKVIILIPILIIALLFSLALAKPYTFTSAKSTDLFHKILNAEKTGNIEISDKEVNELINNMFENTRKVSNINIQKVNVKFNNNDIEIFSQVEYKGIKLQGYMAGALTYDKDYFYLNPTKIKIGYLSMPKALVINTIKSKAIEAVTHDGKFKVSKDYFPYEITKLTQQDSVVKIEFKKKESLIFTDIKKIESDIKNKGENNTQTNNQNTNNITENNSNTSKNNTQSNKTASATTPNNSTNSATADKRKQALNKLNSQLNTVASKLNTSNEKQVVYSLQSTVGNMISNPNYNYAGDISKVKSVYSKLSPEEKNNFKSKLFSNISPSLISELQSLFQ